MRNQKNLNFMIYKKLKNVNKDHFCILTFCIKASLISLFAHAQTQSTNNITNPTHVIIKPNQSK